MEIHRYVLHVAVLGGSLLWRLGLQALLTNQPGIKTVSHTATVDGIAGNPDVFLIDGAVADTLLIGVNAAFPGTPSLIITQTHNVMRLSRWLEQGALGIVDRETTLADLLGALRQVTTGELSLPPQFAVRLVQTMARRAPTETRLTEPLSEREKDVLTLLARGLSNKAIAQQIYVSVRTVEGHLANIYGKLGVHSRTEAALIAVRNGWVSTQ